MFNHFNEWIQAGGSWQQIANGPKKVEWPRDKCIMVPMNCNLIFSCVWLSPSVSGHGNEAWCWVHSSAALLDCARLAASSWFYPPQPVKSLQTTVETLKYDGRRYEACKKQRKKSIISMRIHWVLSSSNDQISINRTAFKYWQLIIPNKWNDDSLIKHKNVIDKNLQQYSSK